MAAGRMPAWQPWRSPWPFALGTAVAVATVAVTPAPLLPVARGFQALCERFPRLALLTFHAPPLPLALLLTLAALAVASGGAAATTRLVGTLRFNRRLALWIRPLPPRLAGVGRSLGLEDRLTYVECPGRAAFCYGFLRPRVAVTAELVERLDDEELAAALAHERHHLRRRDPARYLVLHALAAAAFMFPAAPAIRRRLETRLELAADRAALAVASRGALAGALLTVLSGRTALAVGAAGLSATDARIAHLAGNPVLPPIPAKAMAASVAVAVAVAAAAVDLATSAQLVRMVCVFCR